MPQELPDALCEFFSLGVTVLWDSSRNGLISHAIFVKYRHKVLAFLDEMILFLDYPLQDECCGFGAVFLQGSIIGNSDIKLA